MVTTCWTLTLPVQTTAPKSPQTPNLPRMSSDHHDSDTPDYLDPAKWADMLGAVFISFRILLRPIILFFFLLQLEGLIPLSESSLKIQDESERELIFQQNFVSILLIIPQYQTLHQPSLASIQRPEPTRSAV
jgi:hypothetical protein